MFSRITILLLLFLSVFPVFGWNPKDDIRESLTYQMREYPYSHYRDVYKNFMQDYFGPGHILVDSVAAGNYLRRELATTEFFGGPDFEPTGFNGNFFRVNLRLIDDGTVPYDIFFDTFVNSVRGISAPAPEVWMNIWKRIDGEIRGMGLSFRNEEEDRAQLEQQFKEGNFVVHHSKEFEENTNFHYRIISRDLFETRILPLIKSAEKK